MPQTREAAIVGIHEYPLRVVGPGVSALQIKAASAARALEDAGLTWSDVDAVYDTGSHQSIGGLGISEYFGIKPRLIDNTAVGGTSYEFQANHAATMIAAGKCDVALLTYGSTAHSDRRAIARAARLARESRTRSPTWRRPGARLSSPTTRWSRTAICTSTARRTNNSRTSP